MVISSLAGPIWVWTLALWALGWLALPLARRVFAGLPDGGLAAGRLLFLILVTLFVFWGATIHLVPLKLAPAVAALAALGCASCWRDAKMRDWARQNWRSLAFSDAIFLLSWAAFLCVRLSHPEINDLEKPMDAALLSAAWKTDWLPFAHPWWSGAQFTNYYYFGPLMGALMARALGALPQVAYNLVFAAFCAFFLSTLWSLGAALTRSHWWGVVAMSLVGLSGPLEPLRQWSQHGWSWPFDWWTTSRVIPDTINEYPAFTMAIGDAHAHFYALSFAALWLCLAWSLRAPDAATAPAPRRIILVVAGLVLGAWLMTNTWDAPIFGLLFGLAVWQTRALGENTINSDQVRSKLDQGRSELDQGRGELDRGRSKLDRGRGKLDQGRSNPEQGRSNLRRNMTRPALFLSWLAPFIIASLTAALYFWKFKSPVSGARLDVWLPDMLSFALLWGGWIVLGALAFLLPDSSHGTGDNSARFRRLLILAGLLALVVPFVFYIRGAFGDGDLRHQDTVFKFGLQAWLLLGAGISAELGARVLALAKQTKSVVALASILLAPILFLASASTIWTRAVSQGTARDLGKSLDGMRYLPLAERRAIEWLQHNGRAGEIVMEGVQWKDGSPGGDYDANWGRVGAFSGLSSTLGWPQHVLGWDGNYDQIVERARRINALYALGAPLETARGATALGARYTFFGRMEAGGNWRAPSSEEARAAGFAAHEWSGDDGSRALILERIGR